MDVFFCLFMEFFMKQEAGGNSRIDLRHIDIRHRIDVYRLRWYQMYETEGILRISGFVRIYNPGEFPVGYTPEDFVSSDIPSIVRNPLILKTLFLSDDVESYSSGFRRVFSECGKSGVNISYEINREGFAFIFKRNGVNNDVNE